SGAEGECMAGTGELSGSGSFVLSWAALDRSGASTVWRTAIDFGVGVLPAFYVPSGRCLRRMHGVSRTAGDAAGADYRICSGPALVDSRNERIVCEVRDGSAGGAAAR